MFGQLNVMPDAKQDIIFYLKSLVVKYFKVCQSWLRKPIRQSVIQRVSQSGFEVQLNPFNILAANIAHTAHTAYTTSEQKGYYAYSYTYYTYRPEQCFFTNGLFDRCHVNVTFFSFLFGTLLWPNDFIFQLFLFVLKRFCPLDSKNGFVLVLAYLEPELELFEVDDDL